MKWPVTICLVGCMMTFMMEAAAWGEDSAQFVDPAPPVSASPIDDSPLPQKNSDTTFHAAAKAPAKSATMEDWPCFLGPSHNAFSGETRLLQKFPQGGLTLLWEMNKGEGYAEPAIVGDRLILFHRVGNEEVVECLRPADGMRYWRFAYPTAYQDQYGYCNGPRSSPAVAGDRVFTIGAEGKLHCLQLRNGRPIWSRDLGREFKLKPNFFGVGASPLVEGDKLVVNVGAPKGPCVAAFNLETGKMAWGAGNEWGPSYATPVPATFHGKRQCSFLPGGKVVRPQAACSASTPKTVMSISLSPGAAHASNPSMPLLPSW